MCDIHALEMNQSDWIVEAAGLLLEAFPHSWPDMVEAIEEIYECLEKDKIALVALESNQVVGFIGAKPQYGITGWELHPLVVSKEYQGKEIGSHLVRSLEERILSRGGVMVYLGTDDEFKATSLSEGDLFDNTFEKIKDIKNYKHHPYEFYQKQGYKIVGVFPDANGIGKPDIWMAKRINKGQFNCQSTSEAKH
ncbi:MAG: aminoglycoside 6-acetyltransferase [Herbinix sp.]|nr:aminoglycoside 6-acetyltransferase [Herbinix sp.]